MTADASEPADEFRKVVAGDFCSGCGGCAIASQGRISMRFQPDGRYLPDLNAATQEDLAAAAQACPFSAAGPDEDAIAGALFPDLPQHGAIGRHAACYVGHVTEDGFRDRGSSGGLTSWVAARLLEDGDVDGIIHVRPAHRPRSSAAIEVPMFRFAVSRSVDELANGAKSHYYPVELSAVLSEILAKPGERFAIIGLPCFLKAIRRLSLLDPRVAAAIGPTIGLVCGHLKTAAFAELLAWQAGIAPEALAAIDFRRKLPDPPATAYAMAATAHEGETVVRPMSELAGRDWGQGWFRLNACSFCDDVVGETADISIGDAWLPGWVEDPAGTNVTIARSARMQELLAAGLSSGRLAIQELSPDEVAKSQAGGFRYRRDALELRLADAQDKGRWVPKKRIKPARRIKGQRKRILEIREQMARFSREAGTLARQSGDFSFLLARMQQLAAEERRVARPKLRHRVKRWLKTLLAGAPR
jgi:coenzyme F420-reducing hydrogenase beta subunit